MVSSALPKKVKEGKLARSTMLLFFLKDGIPMSKIEHMTSDLEHTENFSLEKESDLNTNYFADIFKDEIEFQIEELKGNFQ